MHLARLASLDHETDAGARGVADEVVVYATAGKHLLARDTITRKSQTCVSLPCLQEIDMN
jgi:hypothetical protein